MKEVLYCILLYREILSLDSSKAMWPIIRASLSFVDFDVRDHGDHTMSLSKPCEDETTPRGRNVFTGGIAFGDCSEIITLYVHTILLFSIK